jgi:hypothetical protein
VVSDLAYLDEVLGSIPLALTNFFHFIPEQQLLTNTNRKQVLLYCACESTLVVSDLAYLDDFSFQFVTVDAPIVIEMLPSLVSSRTYRCSMTKFYIS